MKKIYTLFAMLLAVSLCFSACRKEESEKDDATLDDFVGTYKVEITATGALEVLSGGTTYEATFTIEKAAAALYNITLAESSTIAKFTFNTTNEDLKATEWYPLLNYIYGYTNNGQMILACADTISGKSLFFTTQMAYRPSSTATFEGYYTTMPFSVTGLIADDKKIKLVTTRIQ